MPSRSGGSAVMKPSKSSSRGQPKPADPAEPRRDSSRHVPRIRSRVGRGSRSVRGTSRSTGSLPPASIACPALPGAGDPRETFDAGAVGADLTVPEEHRHERRTIVIPAAGRRRGRWPLSRWLWLVKWVLVIPHFVVLVFLWIAFVASPRSSRSSRSCSPARHPRGLFDFKVGVLRWSWRVAFYSYSALGHRPLPAVHARRRARLPGAARGRVPAASSRAAWCSSSGGCSRCRNTSSSACSPVARGPASTRPTTTGRGRPAAA